MADSSNVSYRRDIPQDPKALEGKRVRGSSGESAHRIYLVENGVKRWVLSPEAFYAQGWRFEDVVVVPKETIDRIPTSKRIIGQQNRFAERDEIRSRMSSPFLTGRGIEIGACIYPQSLPPKAESVLFDIRSAEELTRLFDPRDGPMPPCFPLLDIPKHFPEGAAFAIVHNVLEHCPDPIGTLIDWSTYVCDRGVLGVSVPCESSALILVDWFHILSTS